MPANSTPSSFSSKPKKRRPGKTSFDFDTDDPLFAKPLSLEFERKRAKKLLKQARENSATKIGLSGIQFDIARQHGFASWPRLVAHIKQAEVERNALKAGHPPALDADKATLHIRCGTDIQKTLEIGGFTGDFIGFFDPFVMGPVTPANSLDDHIANRAKFLSESGWINQTNALESHRKHYKQLELARQYQRVCLWFEHDSFDVLILSYLLNFFSNPANRPRTLQFVCVSQYPGVRQFNGLGQLPPEALRLIWSWFKDVNEPHLILGKSVWEALTAPTPDALMEIIASGTPQIPPFARALKRHLQELPSLTNGLSLVENIILEVLHRHGPMRAGRLFGEYAKREPLPYLGDTMFKTYLENLAMSQQPAITIAPIDEDAKPKTAKSDQHQIWWRAHEISLTPMGQDLLKHTANWLESGAKDRWVGGIKITKAKPGWRWSNEVDHPVLSV